MSLRRGRALTGLGALALLIGTGAASVLHRSSVLLADARRWAVLDVVEARRLAFGSAHTDAIESIRRALPPDSEYLLVTESFPSASGWEVWVRYDLAPRRPILVQRRAGGGLRGPRGSGLPKGVTRAVVQGEGGAPVLRTRDELVAERRARDVDR